MRIIILAGGSGTRLWPLSTQGIPKQFLKIHGNDSLLQKTVKRFLRQPFVESIVISSNLQYEALVRKQLQKIGAQSRVAIVTEPIRRNTAPAISLSMRYLEEKCGANPNDFVFVLPSDHFIEPEEIFLAYLKEAQNVVCNQQIALFGVRPTRAETGYGYIRIGSKMKNGFFAVEQFVEKPSLLKANEYVANPAYYWNTGMFGFSIATFWNEAMRHYPDGRKMRELSVDSIQQMFSKCSDISIDYAIIEKSNNLTVCPLPVNWSDIGSWDSLYETLHKDENGNVKIGNVMDVDTKQCLIFADKKLISTLGVEDIIVVETKKAIFVGKRGMSQAVKEFCK